jgi:hypothetical protein
MSDTKTIVADLKQVFLAKRIDEYEKQYEFYSKE